jgi:3-oxoacyl-[acyl-carrier-protein] synthase-3
MESFMLLDQSSINKVVLLNADVLSRKVSKRDRNSNPLIGDGASITIIERSTNPTIIHGNLKMDGSGASALKIPAGGFKLPSSPETAIMTEDASGNYRSLDNLVMKGDDVFNFVQREVPPLIEDLFNMANINKDEVDYFMFHQPNKFMLNKLADKLDIPRNKMPSNIVENFGNSSGVSIPIVITFNLGDKLKNESFKLCLAGFGVGLTWGSLLLQVGNLNFIENIEY